MRYSEEVKQLAYKMDEKCWVSYSGCAKAHKRAMDTRRNLSLEAAKRYVDARELAKAAHRLQGIVDHQIDLTNAIGDNPFLLYFEKDSGKAVPPKKHTLHGRELKVGSVLRASWYEGGTVKVLELSDAFLKVEIPGLRVSVPWSDVEEKCSWPKEAKSEQEELRHYYDTVITDMCKGTTVEPWECVRFAGNKTRVSGHRPLFNLKKEEYEFALAVHLNRPVWMGSTLYNHDKGVQHTVRNLTHHGKEELLHTSAEGGREGDIDWRDWAVWEKPVKQKAPTRVYVGRPACNGFVNAPEQITGKGTARLVLDFGSNKDAAEFYEVFNRLNSEKEAQG